MESCHPSLPILKFTESEQTVIELIEKQPAPERHSARMAVRHLERTWPIKAIDPEMAYFRSLAAEEEAAAAVFRSMKRLNYPGAEKLNHHSHIHKNALVPFVHAVGKVLNCFVNDGINPQLIIDKTGSGAGKLQVRLVVTPPHSQEEWVLLPEPLHYRVSLNDRPHSFDKELNEIASDANAQGIIAYVRRMAKRRNLVLYAHETGIPVAEAPVDGFIQKRRDNVFMLLVIYLVIDQSEGHQYFVQQAIDTLLKFLAQIEKIRPRDPETSS